MTKLGSKIFGKTEGIKPRERTEVTPTRIKTSPGMFLDTQHRAAKAEAENAVLRNRRVKISELRIIEGRKRQLTVEEFTELKTNLETFPLINPVTIRALPSGGYELVSGHNRVQAYIELGRDEIEANVIDLAEEQILPAAFYSNLLSPALPDYEKYLGFKQLQQSTGKSQTELAKESGVSKTMISMLFGFDDLNDDIHAILGRQPQLISATLVNKFKKLPFALEAIKKLAAGDINHQQAITLAGQQKQPSTTLSKPSPVIIKKGKGRYAEINLRGSTLIIKVADAGLAQALSSKIETLLRQESATKDV